MDKNKNRTDLLAAGRKKLQQFRQKKDGKGGKSSKASRSAGDATPDLVDVRAKSDQVPDGEKPLHRDDGTPASSESITKKDLPAKDSETPLDESNNVHTVETTPASGKLVKEDAGELEAALNSDSGGQDIVDSSSITEHANAKMGNEDVKDDLLEDPGIVASDVSIKSSAMDVPVEFSSYSSADEAVAHQVAVERLHVQEQVTDVGTMQESHNSGSKKGDSSIEVEIEGDKKLPLNEPSETSVSQKATLVGDEGKEETKAEYIQLSKPNNVPSTVLATPNAEIPEERGHQMEDAVSGSCKEEKLEMPSGSGQYENYRDEVQISDSRDIVSENSVENKMVNISSKSDASYISLCQLAEVVRDLEEDDFRFLLTCRDSAPNAPSLKLFDFFEKLKEQLYLASLVKDVSCFQLAEESEIQMELSRQHHKLTDLISAAKASSTKLGEKNDVLAEQLAQSRSEFQLIVSERDDLLKKLHNSKGEVGEFSDRINELQTKLEVSLGENASLSSEMVDCRNLVATLQVRNESLIGSLNLLSEENKKLLEEKENLVLENKKLGTDLAQCKALFGSLQLDNEDLSQNFTSLSEEKMKLHGEKEHLISENEKLFAQLSDCKNVVEALQVENKNINGSLISVTEAKNQLQEENKCLLSETEKQGLEFKESKSLIEALQTEVAEAKGHLTSVMEKRNELEEQKKQLLNETEKQSLQLAEYKNLCNKVEDDLKNATLHIEHLTEENMHLRRSLELAETMKTESPNQSSFAYQLEGSCHSNFAPENLIDDDGSNWFGVMKRHMEDAERVLEKLENAVEGMQSQLISMCRSSGKAVSPGVSKLIQAFESKDHDDEHQSEEFQSSENKTNADPYVLIQGLTKTLRASLKDLVLAAGSGYQFLEGEKSSKTATEVAAEELRAKYESLNEHIDLLGGANIELMVFNESLGGCLWNAKERDGDLVVLNEALHKQEVATKAENSQLRENLSGFQEKLPILQNQLGEMRESCKEMGSFISNQVEALYKEVANRGSVLQEEWNSTIDQVFQTLRRLDLSVEAFGSSSPSDHDLVCTNLSRRTAASIDAAINVIESLQGQVEAARHESMLRTSREVNEKLDFLQIENEKSLSLLYKIYGNLKKLVKEMPGNLQEAEVDDSEKSIDLSHPGAFDSLLEQLQRFLDEKTEVDSVNEKLKSELMARTKDSEELSKRSLGSDSILRVVQVVEGLIPLDSFEININEPVSCLESLTSLLVQKYKEATEEVRLSREECASKEAQVIDLQGQMDHLSSLLVQFENEVVVLGESLKRAEEAVVSIGSQYQEKVAEFEQSEQRVSSLREKLGIAVTKGKGLIVQRDSLKQSLADTSSELQKCSEELQLKDARLQEVEMKLKTYSEAGERNEALESELSYIRNSATAIRESFLLKDSVLQKIEEILEDLELPDHFHSKDIIDKVDWLAKSVSGNSVPLTDWDNKSSIGGSYSDAGYALGDGWKEASQTNLGSSEDLRRRFEELQGKFYGLAEQNEMLEQSLMERNNLVQKWEEMLDRIEMPSHLRSLEPEDRIGWLVLAVSEAENQYNSLQQKYDNFESLFASTTAELEESNRKISELDNAYQLVVSEKELLLKSLESLNFDLEEMSRKAARSETSNDDLQNRVDDLQKKLNEMLGAEGHVHHLEGELRRLEDVIKDFLWTSETDDVLVSSGSIESLEQLIRKLIDKYATLSLGKPSENDTTLEHVDKVAELSHEEKKKNNVSCDEDADGDALSRKLEDALGDLLSLKEEKESIALTNQSLVRELEDLGIRNKELQDLLSQEEQKSSSLREKLNVAVRKGKSLVQHRDSLKQLIEELNGEVERLKSEIRLQENAISDYERRIKDLSVYSEKIKTIESESSILRDQLTEKEYTLSMVLSSLDEINIGSNIGDPVEKLKSVVQLCHDLQSTLASSEHEAKKSKRAAELLLAELNEVQERNDGLQEELAKSLSELSGLSKQKESAEVAKHEALERLEKLSSVHSEERKNQLAEITILKSGVDQLGQDLFVVDRLLTDVLSMDLETMYHLGSSMKVCQESTDQNNFPLLVADSSGLTFAEPENKVFGKEIGSIYQKLNRHSHLLREEAARLSEILRTIHEDISYHKQLSNSLKADVMQLEYIQKEKDAELLMVQRYNAMLYEACTTLFMEIERRKSQLVGSSLASGAPRTNSVYQSLAEGKDLAEMTDRFSEEGIRSVIEKLFMAVKDIMSVQNDIAEFGQKDMKAAISNLQKELQEKDVQREKICAELVSQIHEAESISKSYSQELQMAKAQMDDLHRKVKLMEEEQDSLTHRIKELQDQESNFADLQLRVKSLEDMLAAKEQENEALMQALDEEEAQMEDMTNKIEEMERVLLQKNKDAENLEISRGKTMKKLSVTVSKFDELHQLSESLLSEVENLQSQLQERDTEISFLRQEVTRCTNDAIASAQMSSKRESDEIHNFLTWVDKMISRVQAHDMNYDDAKVNQIHEYKQMLEKQVVSVISELEDLRALAQTKDLILKVEKDKVEQLVRKEEFLENSLRDKESQLTMLRGASDIGQPSNSTSEIIEIEPVANKRAVPGTIASQVRSLRKTNSDQVAVAIDVDPDSGKLDDEDDDKAHGFKSMTTSRIVPRFTRPITDMIDGLWVSCGRTLMRQPVLRLSVIIYWVVLHALLATFVV